MKRVTSFSAFVLEPGDVDTRVVVVTATIVGGVKKRRRGKSGPSEG